MPFNFLVERLSFNYIFYLIVCLLLMKRKASIEVHICTNHFELPQ